LFRQKDAKSWNSAFQSLYSALEEKFNLKHIDMPNEDKETKRLNLGCGLNRFDGFLNVDKSDLVPCDQTVDLNVFPWPWKDSEFQHIVAKDILEHLGEKPSDIINVIKEMYRVSENGAIWEIQAPHWNCETAKDDPTHVRAITIAMFNLFNKKLVFDKAQMGSTESMLAFEEDVDIEVCDTQFDYTPPFAARLKDKSITQEELTYSLNHLNNVALSFKVLIQVHKPGRFDIKELKQMIAGNNESAKS
jgi:hypothetical protein